VSWQHVIRLLCAAVFEIVCMHAICSLYTAVCECLNWLLFL
jgi:hypothetical protein